MTKPKKKPPLLFTLYLLSVWAVIASLLLLALQEYFQGKADDWDYLTDHARFSTPSESPVASVVPGGQCPIEYTGGQLEPNRLQEDEGRPCVRDSGSNNRW